MTVAEVAKTAEVSVNTVFNYFRTKEELFLDRLPEIEVSLDRAVQNRAVGESAVAAVRRTFLEWLDQRDYRSGLADGIATCSRIIRDSQTLAAAAQAGIERMEQSLADTLAEETGTAPDDIAARVVASQIMGVYTTLHAEITRRLAAGETADEIHCDIAAATRQAFDLLEHGAGDYCTRPG